MGKKKILIIILILLSCVQAYSQRGIFFFINIDSSMYADVRGFIPGTGTKAYKDSCSIVNAYNYVQDGGIIYLPIGTYDLSSFHMTVSKRVTFRGESNTKTIIEGDSTQNGENGNGNQFTIQHGCKFDNIKFHKWDTPIRLAPTADKQISGFSVTNCNFRGINKSCVEFDYGDTDFLVENVLLDKNDVRDSQQGFRFQGPLRYVRASGNVFKNIVRNTSGASAMIFGCTNWATDSSGSFSVYGNIADTLHGHDSETHMVLAFGYDISVFGNEMNYIWNDDPQSGDEGIYIKGERVSITGNHALNAGTYQGSYVVKSQTGKKAIISYNTARYTADFPTENAILGYAPNATISNNIIEIESAEGDAIFWNGYNNTGNVKFIANEIKTDSSGIKVNNTKKLELIGNTVECEDDGIPLVLDRYNGIIEITGGHYESDSAMCLKGRKISNYLTITGGIYKSGNVTPTDGVVDINTGGDSAYINISNAILEVDSTKSSGRALDLTCGNVTITGNTIRTEGDVSSQVYLNTDSTVNFSGNTFTAKHLSDDVNESIYIAGNPEIMAINTNVFTAEESNYGINRCVNIGNNVGKMSFSTNMINDEIDAAIYGQSGKTITKMETGGNVHSLGTSFFNNFQNVTVSSGYLEIEKFTSDSIGVIYYDFINSKVDTVYMRH